MPTIISEPEIKPRHSNSDSGMDYYKHFDSVVKPKNYSVSVPDIDSYLGNDLTIHSSLKRYWREKFTVGSDLLTFSFGFRTI